MILLEKAEVFGWESAIRGMRNPLNSWDKSDTKFNVNNETGIWLGANDKKLMKLLSKAGNDHAKFLRMINVTVDITASHTWWAEFDTYKVGTVRNSCSKMHKIHVKEFVKDDFDHEGIDAVSANGGTTDLVLQGVINELEWLRQKFNETHDKMYWRAIIELLPMGYRIKATVQLNYAVLKNMYFARKNHKLDEWREFCLWCIKLPYFSEIVIVPD